MNFRNEQQFEVQCVLKRSGAAATDVDVRNTRNSSKRQYHDKKLAFKSFEQIAAAI